MISYTSEGIRFRLKQKRLLSKWLREIAMLESMNIRDLNYIFLSDEGLLAINQQYLNHDTYTDIITFDNSEDHSLIEGDIFISVDRVKENALSFKTAFEDELRRVMAHGLLHLCGYKDKKKAEASEMRIMEEKSLAIWKNLND